MAVLPVRLGAMEVVPPGLRYRVRDVLALLPAKGGALDGACAERLARLEVDGEPWLGADPALAEVGAWMIDARNAPELRERGCAWLALFPTVDSIQRLAALAADGKAPPAVRERAIWALGDREQRGKHPATRWSGDAVQLADEALVRLADAATNAGAVASAALPLALRHVQWEGAFAPFARKPGLWGAALECYGSPALARVLLVCLEDIAAAHRPRALALIAAALGEEAVPMLLARAVRAAAADAVEMQLLVVALAGERALGGLEDALRAAAGDPEPVRARAKWHLANRGAIPAVRALRVARATGVLAPGEREAQCGAAADDLAAQARFGRFAEAERYAAWAELVRGSRDPARARELVGAHPAAMRGVRDLYFAELARRGKVGALVTAAYAGEGAGDPDALAAGAMQLAVWGRPLAALQLARTAARHSPELVYARALACYRAGRADLARELLDGDPPPAELVDDGPAPAFPGPHEQWLAANAPDTAPAAPAAPVAAVAAVVALVAGMREIAELAAGAKPAPFDAEPDAASLEPLAPIARRLARELRGATVFLAGEIDYMRKGTLAAAIEKVGARLVGAPYAGTDFYVAGEPCPAALIYRLERLGARRLREGELA